MGASGYNLRIDKVPFGGKKGMYSSTPVDNSSNEQQIPNYKEYIPINSSSDSSVVDFPNNLTKKK